MPGFIDLHTHYEAEVELTPALSGSVRHGVTSVMAGSCSLSLAVGSLVPDGVFVHHRVLRLLEKRGALSAQGLEDAQQYFRGLSRWAAVAF